jgi:hypothetical protein
LDSLLIFDTSTTAPFLLAKMINTKLELTASKDKLPDPGKPGAPIFIPRAVVTIFEPVWDRA